LRASLRLLLRCATLRPFLRERLVIVLSASPTFSNGLLAAIGLEGAESIAAEAPSTLACASACDPRRRCAGNLPACCPYLLPTAKPVAGATGGWGEASAPPWTQAPEDFIHTVIHRLPS